MNQEELEKILIRFDSDNSWLNHKVFVGESNELRTFLDNLNQVASRFRDSVNPEIIFFNRIGKCRRIDDAVVEILGYPASQSIQLCPGCDVYNHKQLFGDSIELSIFEKDLECISIVYLEHLSPRLLTRFVRNLSVWLTQHPKKVLLIGEPLVFPEDYLHPIRQWTTELPFPRLKNRKQDVVYELQLAARAFEGGVDRFSLEALNSLLEHDWDGDVGEIEQVVFRIFRQCEDKEEIGLEQVDFCLIKKDKVRDRRNDNTDILDRWRDVVAQREDIDRIATSLIGSPFFSQRAETSTQRPLGSGCPELDFFRLVSWAYMMFVECGGPNIASVAKLAGGLRVNVEAIQETRDTVGRLRTFLQHSLQYGSHSDQQTIEQASRWFDAAVGRLHPLEQDYRVCSIVLLRSIATAFNLILSFLRRLNEDEYKHVVLQQWKDRIEDVWPKHQFDAAINKAIISLQRSDLDLDSICKKLLPKMQERLKVTSKETDRHKALKEYAEYLIDELFPSKKSVEEVVSQT